MNQEQALQLAEILKTLLECTVLILSAFLMGESLLERARARDAYEQTAALVHALAENPCGVQERSSE